MSQRISVPQLNIDDITLCIRESVRTAQNEEEVRVRVSRCIEDKILKPLSLQNVIGRYEYTLVSGARADALYGHVIVEYKAPGKLSSDSDIQRAKEQVIRYIKDEARSEAEWPRYLGVIISDKIAFVRYDPRTREWIRRGPYEINPSTVKKLVEALRGLSRKSLGVDNLIADFGPRSTIARKTIKLLYDKLRGSKSPRTKALFEDWMRLFRQATGYGSERLEELPELAAEYGLSGDVDYDSLIFAIHTYYALIMKLLAAEIAYLYGEGRFYKSYVAELDDAYSRRGVEGVREVLRDLESGGIFRSLLHIENFLEGDYFSWYLDEFDADLADAVAEIARRLSEYEIATPQLEPEFARDLLKRLYQNLVPRDLRHRLGEYYTPDWLADLILDEVGLSLDDLRKMGEGDPLRPLTLRVLDPACGSGTFLVLYISRLRRYAEEHYLTELLWSYVLENVVGYDLNPLAVLAARTNYLLAIADLLPYARGSVEIPIYLADSILVERRSNVIYGDTYVLKTAAGEFEIPKSIVDKGLLRDVLSEIVNALRNGYAVKDFKDRIEYRFKGLRENDFDSLAKLYETLLKLEKEGKDDVWVSVLRNAFAPILKGKFDYVVGNPPWVNWENLPESYREASKSMWQDYGLAEIRGKPGLGKVKRDLAMLFLVRSFDQYVREGGKLGFLLPFTVFKSQAGAGFREFLATKARISIIHDLVTLYPFEGAVNRTAAIVVEKVCELSRIKNGECPQIGEVRRSNISGARHVIWIDKLGKSIPTDMPLEEVQKRTARFEALMLPVDPDKPSSPWMQATLQAVGSVRKLTSGAQHYKAHAGVNVGLNQVYFIKILEKLPNGMLRITNPPSPRRKKEVKLTEAVVELDLIYPLIQGEDVKRWYIGLKGKYVLVPHDPSTGKPLPESVLKVRMPQAYDYLNRYRSELENRTIHKKWGKGNPFYSVYDIGSYTFTPYKVVWKEIAGAITGKAVSFACAVVEPVADKFLGARPVVPDHTSMLIGFNNPDEAYYVAGILNSTPARAVIASYTYELRQETHIADVVKIPKYDPKNGLHRKISELSRKAHEIAKEIYEKGRKDLEGELKKVEDEIDLAVANLFGISEDGLSELKRLLAILSGEEPPEEEEAEVPEVPVINVLNTFLRPNEESHIEVDVVNPSNEEIAFTYELPWGKGSFSIVEGKYKIPTPPLRPGKYKGVLRWVWRGKEGSLDVIIEVSEPVGPRRKS